MLWLCLQVSAKLSKSHSEQKIPKSLGIFHKQKKKDNPKSRVVIHNLSAAKSKWLLSIQEQEFLLYSKFVIGNCEKGRTDVAVVLLLFTKGDIQLNK